MILLLTLLLSTPPTQNLTWYEYYERGEKQFRKEQYDGCIADMQLALEQKAEPARNQFTRAVQKIDYKPFYYLALAYFEKDDIAQAYHFAQLSFKGEVLREAPALQSDLGPILERYRQHVATFHQQFQDEQRIIGIRKELLQLISQSRYKEARTKLDSLGDQTAFTDIASQLELGSRIANQANSFNSDLKERIESLLAAGNKDTARQLFQTFRDELPQVMRQDIQTQIANTPEPQKAEPQTQEATMPVEPPPPQQTQESAELIAFRKRWAEMENERDNLTSRLTNLSKDNEDLKARLDQQQDRQTPSDPPAIVISLKQQGGHVRASVKTFTILAIESLSYNWNGQNVEPSPAELTRTNNQHEFSFELKPIFGINTFQMTVTDSAGQSSQSSESLVVERPWYLYYQLWVAVFLLCLILVITRMVIMRRRRKSAALRHFNPYIAGSPVRDDVMFYGRDDLMKRIQGLVHKNSFMIHGARRIGKTSMLHQLRQNLAAIKSDEYRFFPVFIDLQGIREADLFHHMMAEIYAQADLWDIQLDDLIYDENDHNYLARQFSKDIKRIIHRLSEANDQHHIQLVLLMDEVDVLNEFHEKANQKLRGIFMKDYAEHLTCVMAGIHLKKEWDSSGSPWYNFFEQIPVAAFTEEHARDLVLKPVKGTFHYAPKAVDLIINSTSCHPYLIQKVCVSLIDAMLRGSRYKITVKDAQTALDQLDAEIQRNRHELHHQPLG